jgi:hypothetical protein
MPGADKRVDRLSAAHLDMLHLGMKLAHIDVPPGNEELRQRIAVALQAVHAVEWALLQAIEREPPRARRPASSEGSKERRRGGYTMGDVTGGF